MEIYEFVGECGQCFVLQLVKLLSKCKKRVLIIDSQKSGILFTSSVEAFLTDTIHYLEGVDYRRQYDTKEEQLLEYNYLFFLRSFEDRDYRREELTGIKQHFIFSDIHKNSILKAERYVKEQDGLFTIILMGVEVGKISLSYLKTNYFHMDIRLYSTYYSEEDYVKEIEWEYSLQDRWKTFFPSYESVLFQIAEDILKIPRWEIRRSVKKRGKGKSSENRILE